MDWIEKQFCRCKNSLAPNISSEQSVKSCQKLLRVLWLCAQFLLTITQSSKLEMLPNQKLTIPMHVSNKCHILIWIFSSHFNFNIFITRWFEYMHHISIWIYSVHMLIWIYPSYFNLNIFIIFKFKYIHHI